MDFSGTMGGVTTGTVNFVPCPRCQNNVGIRAGFILRVPAEGKLCHEIVDPVTGHVVRRTSKSEAGVS